jgi:hypothetical protein
MKNASGMRTFLIIMLAISGVLAALAILAPVSVELGLYMLLIPGLILMIAPTIFMALLVFGLVWWIGSKATNTKVGALLGVAAVLALMTIPPFLDGNRTKAALAAARQDPMRPSGPVALAGDIWLKLPKGSFFINDSGCSGLCMDILDRPGVTALTEEYVLPNGTPKVTRYRLLTNEGACQQVKRDRPATLIPVTDFTDYIAEGGNMDIYEVRKAAFESGTTCLITEPVQQGARAHTIAFADSGDMSVDMSWDLSSQPRVHAETLTIHDQNGKTEFFGGNWTARALAMPLRTDFGRIGKSPALGWATRVYRVGETDYSPQSLLYIAVFGKPPLLASERAAQAPASKGQPTQP